MKADKGKGSPRLRLTARGEAVMVVLGSVVAFAMIYAGLYFAGLVAAVLRAEQTA